MGYAYTANGALAYNSTNSDLYNLFAIGASYRDRSEEDCIMLFSKAFDESPSYAMKCLFYIRAIAARADGLGQGERRFFRVCMNWAAKHYPEYVRRNLQYIPEMGRWDDLYCLMETPVEKDALDFLYKQIQQDAITIKTSPNKPISLAAKWCASINASSAHTKALGAKTAKHFNMTPREYRKVLSALRKRINIVERLMSAQKWDEINFSDVPSHALLQYMKCFRKRPETAERFRNYISAKGVKLNAATLYPYDIIHKLEDTYDEVEEKTLEELWKEQKNVFESDNLNALVVLDTSGSMNYSYSNSSVTPFEIGMSLAIYTAERNKNLFANKFISFSTKPEFLYMNPTLSLLEKVQFIRNHSLFADTNLEATFDLVLNEILRNRNATIVPKYIIVISDMQINKATLKPKEAIQTMMETMRVKWNNNGLEMPRLVYWNCNAVRDTFLDMGPNVTYVSGASPSNFKAIMSGKQGYSLMLDALENPVFGKIH